MNQRTPIKEENFPLAYITDMKKVYFEAIDTLTNSDKISVIAVNNPGETMMSLVYMCTVKEVFVFDIIKFGINRLPRDLIEIIMSDKLIKIVFSERNIISSLGFDDNIIIPNVYDIEFYAEALRQKLDNRISYIRQAYDIELIPDNNQLPTIEFLPISTQPSLSEVDWTVRPFKANEHFTIAKHFFQFISLLEQLKSAAANLP